MRTVRYVISAFVIFSLLLIAFFAGFLAHRWMTNQWVQQPVQTEEQFAVFWEAWNIAQQHFVDPSALDARDMTYGAIRGALDSLGDVGHTRFLTPEEYQAEEAGMLGQYSGIGAEIGIRDGHPVIVAPIDGSPAQEAGLQPGDIIVRVDGEDVTNYTLDQVITLIRGPEGKPVTLELLRPGEPSMFEVTLVRATIRVDAVSWTMLADTGIAHIRISEFSQNALSGVKTAISAALAQGAKGLVVDVRSNPGGLLDQAVTVSSQFLKSGNVVLERGRDGSEKAYPVIEGGVATDISLVVLVNEGSASASEIFAGAIQDQQRGLIVGQTTFGTGTILSTFILRDGSAMLLGTGEWLTPNGKSLRNEGITPDVEVALPADGTILTPSEAQGMSLQDIEKTGDTQLMRGIETLMAEMEAAQ